MRSIVHAVYGEPAEVLAVADSPLPEPGPGQARVRMLLSPIHNHDLWTVRGQYGYKPTLPAIAGSEAFGVVDALGEGVEGMAIGQRVTTAGARGAWAEYFVVPANSLVPVPDAIDDASAAQLVAMPLSALMLLEMLDVSAGDWIVQNAANGAVGKALAMLARARGVNVLNLVRREEGVAEMAAQGIGNTVCTMHEGWKAQARDLMGGARPKAAVDSVSGPASGVLCSLLGENGLLVSFGSMTGESMQIPVRRTDLQADHGQGLLGHAGQQGLVVAGSPPADGRADATRRQRRAAIAGRGHLWLRGHRPGRAGQPDPGARQQGQDPAAPLSAARSAEGVLRHVQFHRQGQMIGMRRRHRLHGGDQQRRGDQHVVDRALRAP